MDRRLSSSRGSLGPRDELRQVATLEPRRPQVPCSSQQSRTHALDTDGHLLQPNATHEVNDPLRGSRIASLSPPSESGGNTTSSCTADTSREPESSRERYSSPASDLPHDVKSYESLHGSGKSPMLFQEGPRKRDRLRNALHHVGSRLVGRSGSESTAQTAQLPSARELHAHRRSLIEAPYNSADVARFLWFHESNHDLRGRFTCQPQGLEHIKPQYQSSRVVYMTNDMLRTETKNYGYSIAYRSPCGGLRWDIHGSNGAEPTLPSSLKTLPHFKVFRSQPLEWSELTAANSFISGGSYLLPPSGGFGTAGCFLNMRKAGEQKRQHVALTSNHVVCRDDQAVIRKYGVADSVPVGLMYRLPFQDVALLSVPCGSKSISCIIEDLECNKYDDEDSRDGNTNIRCCGTGEMLGELEQGTIVYKVGARTDFTAGL